MDLTTSVLAALAATLCWGFGDFFLQRCVRVVGNVDTLAWNGLFGIVLLAPLIIGDIGVMTRTDVLLLSALGVATFLAAIAEYEALKVGKLSVVEVLFSIELPLTVLLGTVLFRELLTLPQLLAIIVIFVGGMLVSNRAKSLISTMTLEKGVLLAILGALIMAFVNYLTALTARGVSPAMAIWFPSVVFTILCFGLLIKRKTVSGFWMRGWHHRGVLTGMGILDTAAWLLFAVALVGGTLSITTAITEAYPAVAVVLGVWFNKEKLHGHQWVGIVVTLLASVALALGL